MKCSFCNKDFPESLVHLSHDVPCYLFIFAGVGRNVRKNLADKHSRRYLCKECHDDYEKKLNDFLIKCACQFGYAYFETNELKEDEMDGDSV